MLSSCKVWHITEKARSGGEVRESSSVMIHIVITGMIIPVFFKLNVTLDNISVGFLIIYSVVLFKLPQPFIL